MNIISLVRQLRLSTSNDEFVEKSVTLAKLMIEEDMFYVIDKDDKYFTREASRLKELLFALQKAQTVQDEKVNFLMDELCLVHEKVQYQLYEKIKEIPSEFQEIMCSNVFEEFSRKDEWRLHKSIEKVKTQRKKNNEMRKQIEKLKTMKKDKVSIQCNCNIEWYIQLSQNAKRDTKNMHRIVDKMTKDSNAEFARFVSEQELLISKIKELEQKLKVLIKEKNKEKKEMMKLLINQKMYYKQKIKKDRRDCILFLEDAAAKKPISIHSQAFSHNIKEVYTQPNQNMVVGVASLSSDLERMNLERTHKSFFSFPYSANYMKDILNVKFGPLIFEIINGVHFESIFTKLSNTSLNFLMDVCDYLSKRFKSKASLWLRNKVAIAKHSSDDENFKKRHKSSIVRFYYTFVNPLNSPNGDTYLEFCKMLISERITRYYPLYKTLDKLIGTRVTLFRNEGAKHIECFRNINPYFHVLPKRGGVIKDD